METFTKHCRMPSKAALPWVAAGATVAGVAATPVVVPALVHIAGFGSSGIAAGSWAASFMSSYAGVVPAGSVCALLQSVGAAGLSAATIGTAEAAAAGLAVIFGRKFLWGCRGGGSVKHDLADL